MTYHKVKRKKKNIYQLYLSMCEERKRKMQAIPVEWEYETKERDLNDIKIEGEDCDASVKLEKKIKKKLEEQTNLLTIKGIDRVDIKQSKGKHSIICIHYIKNMCMKNIFCNYLHQLIYARIPTCKNYLKYNYCSDKVRGSCMFRHTIENTIINFPAECKDEFLEDALKYLYEKNICVNYALGFCHLGINCRRTHKLKSRKYANGINILPKFYLDSIIVNKQLYANLYNSPQKIQSDLNKLNEYLLLLYGEQGYEQLISGIRERENEDGREIVGSRKKVEEPGDDSESKLAYDYKNAKLRIYTSGNHFASNGKSVTTQQDLYKGSLRNNELPLNYLHYAPITTNNDNNSNNNNHNNNNNNNNNVNTSCNNNNINSNNNKIKINKDNNSNINDKMNNDNTNTNKHLNFEKNRYNSNVDNSYEHDESNNVNSGECIIPNVYDINNNIIQNDRFKVFVIKCNQISHLYLSILYGVWATGKNNTRKFINLLKENYTIIFLFSVNESGGFQGYAKMVTLPIRNLYENLWGAITNRLGGNFRVQWIKTAKIDFDVFKNMVNSCNNNLPLKKSRDGTELPLHLASIICKRINALQGDDFLSGTIYEYKRRINHNTYFANLHKKKLLNTCTYWDRQIFYLNQQSDCKEITYVDGTEQTLV